MEKLWSKCWQLFKVSGEAQSRSGLCYLLSMIIAEAAGKQDKNAVYELSVLNALRSHWLGGGTEELWVSDKITPFCGIIQVMRT